MKGMRRTGILAAAVIILFTMALSARAQVTTASVVGTVKDQQGAVVPGATVLLVSEAKGTKSTPVVTNDTGDFVVANIPADTYTVEVDMPSFKTLKRAGVVVDAGSRVVVGTLTIEVGGQNEVVDVKAETPVIQAASGERSYTVEPDQVASLPIATRSFDALAALSPGVSGDNRIGSSDNSNYMMDGVSTLDTGSNRLLFQVNVESIAEVKVLTSDYQAEYGRSAGLQMSAITKSGTNQFHGSVYDVEKNSDWSANSETNILNGQPKAVAKSRDWGYSIGGPIGKPGGNNKLFFFYAQEFQPLTTGGNTQLYRVPTALEREGNFSQTTDNLGNPYPYIKNPALSGACNATSQAACFDTNGVLGEIPANDLYSTGIAILNTYPLPNVSTPGLPYNYSIVEPIQHLLAYQPAVKIDYQPWQSLRASLKYSAWDQRKQVILGTIPGYNDSIQPHPVVSTWASTVDYSLNSTTFLEGTWGRAKNEEAGCALVGGAPVVCQNGLPTDPISNLDTAGLGGLPFLYPNATVIPTNTYAYTALSETNPPFWNGTQVLKEPTFSWGSRIADAPPSILYPGFLNTNPTRDLALSLTKVTGHHTFKGGIYNDHSEKAEQNNSNPFFGTLSFANDTNNPLDTSYGFSNAAVGVYDSYNQASSYLEGPFIYSNWEGYIEDNWKVTPKLTLDYGMRFTHQGADYDVNGQESTFINTNYSASQAPVLYTAGCAGGKTPCSGANREAVNPLTNEPLGPNSALAIGTVVPGSGNLLDGIYQPGFAPSYLYPDVSYGPRFGLAYDVTGKQNFVVRGGMGLFYDQPQITNAEAVTNPPETLNETVQYGQLQTLGTSGLAITAAPIISDSQYHMPLPTSLQWNVGPQMTLPWYMTLDVSYVGQHSWNTQQFLNINTIPLGTAFLPQYQDATLAPSSIAGANAVQTNLLEPIAGYGAINQLSPVGWTWYHSIQMSLQRRFVHGLSFGFVDTIGLSNTTNAPLRITVNTDGTYSVRSDQAQANTLLGTDATLVRQTLKANFVWTLPTIKSQQTVLRAIGVVANDWHLAAIWTASTGAPYTVGFSYNSNGASINLTGSPNYAARVVLTGSPGAGCSSNVYQQFNTGAFEGPPVGSVGLDSGVGYLHGCFQSALDLSLSRTIKLGGSRSVQLRVDAFNAPNQDIITGRVTTMTLGSPSAPSTVLNLPYAANGTVIPTRSQPSDAGFGEASAYQAPRTMQAQIRFQF